MTTASLNIRVDSSEVSKADRSLDDLAKSGANADKSATKLTSSTERLSSVARVAAGAFAALGASVSVREIIQASDAWQSAANQLRLVTNSASELSAVQSKLMGVSNDTRSSFESTANLYTRLTRATSEMGLSQSELIGLTTTINQSFAVSGATAAEAAAAITQLSQGLAAGALRGDEFNSVAEQAPGIMRAIADSLNMTTGELRAFAAEGGITADIVVTALQGAATSIDQDFGKSVMTFGQSMQVAKNNMLEFVGTSEAVTGAVSAAGSSMIMLTENLDAVLGVAQTLSVLYAGNFLGSMVAAKVATMEKAAATAAQTAVTIAQLKAETELTAANVASTAAQVASSRAKVAAMLNSAASVAAVTAAEASATQAVNAHATALARYETVAASSAATTGRIGSAVAALGGPVGVFMLAAFATYKFADAIRDLDKVWADSKLQSIANNIAGGADVIKFAMYNVRSEINGLNESLAALDASSALDQLAGLGSKDERREELKAQIAALTAELERYAIAMSDSNKKSEEAAEAAAKHSDSTLKLIDALQNEKKALTMTAREQAMFAAELKALANGDGPDAIETVRRLAAENYDLAESQEKAKDELEAFNASIAEYLKEQKRSREETEKNIKSVYETIGALENEKIALDMTARSAAVFQAVTQATANGALPDQIAQIATLTAELYDMEAAQDATGESAKTAARVAEEAWGRTHDYMSGVFVDLMNNGGNAFDNIAKSFEQMVKRMVAEWAASKLMDVFGMKAPSGGGGGLGAIGSILGSIGKGGATQPGGVAGTMSAGARIGSTVASVGSSVAGAASSAGSALMSAAAAVPGWGWALAAAAVAAAALSKKETPSSNAGFLLRPVGNGERQFDVPAFDSGFDPVGFARREDQAGAVQVIDTFRQYDAALTGIAKASGLSVNYSANQFGGFDESGRGSGLFFGTAAEKGSGTTSTSIDQQLNQFVGQWVKGLSGQVDQSLINDVLSAGSADEMVKRAAMLAGVDGSHANGLDYVPYDGYRAVLHRGEAVVTASENRDQKGGTMAAMISELSAMRAELSRIRQSVSGSLNIMDKWDGEGMPAVRT